MKMLKSKLLDLKEKENKEKLDNIKGEQKENAWGSQIRSYVFHPYSLVKDLRTGYETGNTEDGHKWAHNLNGLLLFNDDIKTILTKEQYMQNCYTVERKE